MLEKSEGATSGSSGPSELRKRSLARCLRERQWVPPALCASVKQLNLEDGKQLSSWFTENEDAIQRLEPVFSYVFGAMDGRVDDGTCPESPIGGARE